MKWTGSYSGSYSGSYACYKAREACTSWSDRVDRAPPRNAYLVELLLLLLRFVSVSPCFMNGESRTSANLQPPADNQHLAKSGPK